MAQLIFMAVLIVGGLLLYRRFINDAEKLTARRKQQEKERQTGAVGTLEKDPVTGEYRVTKEEE